MLQFATFKPPQTFDVGKYTATNNLLYLYPVYASLLEASANGSINPGLATSWQMKQNSLTLKLRRGVRFSDGAPFDARAVLQNIQRCKQIGGSCGTTLAGVKSVDIPDRFTVILRTRGPQPWLLYGLTTPAGMMVSPRAMDSPDLGRQPVGAGPYVLDASATVPGSKYVYAKNPRYWNPKAQTLSRIEIVSIGSAQQRVNAMRTGQINSSMVGDAQELASYRQGGFKISISKHGDPFALLVLNPTGPFADKRVRQALGYAINREALTQSPARKGLANPSDQLFTKGRRGYVSSPSFEYTYDPAKAKSLLQQAGAKDVSFTIPAQPGPQNLTEAQAVAGMLNAVGFHVNVVQPPPQLIMNEIFSGNYPVVYTPVFVRDAAELASAISPQGWMNPKHIPDSEVTRLKQQAALATVKTPKTAATLYGELMVHLAEQGIVIPVFEGPAGSASTKDVRNLRAWSGEYMGPPLPRGVTVGG